MLDIIPNPAATPRPMDQYVRCHATSLPAVKQISPTDGGNEDILPVRISLSDQNEDRDLLGASHRQNVQISMCSPCS